MKKYIPVREDLRISSFYFHNTDFSKVILFFHGNGGNAFDSRKKFSSLSIPILIIHGEQDQIIPIKLSEELASLNLNAQLQVLPLAGHNDLVRSSGELYFASIEEYLKK
jgi:pimeloyl-ACP methyl ester carboxylesterase